MNNYIAIYFDMYKIIKKYKGEQIKKLIVDNNNKTKIKITYFDLGKVKIKELPLSEFKNSIINIVLKINVYSKEFIENTIIFFGKLFDINIQYIYDILNKNVNIYDILYIFNNFYKPEKVKKCITFNQNDILNYIYFYIKKGKVVKDKKFNKKIFPKNIFYFLNIECESVEIYYNIVKSIRPTDEWMENIQEYIESDLFGEIFLEYYTKTRYYIAMNKILELGTIPEDKKENIKKILNRRKTKKAIEKAQYYANQFNNLFEKSPPLDKDIIVFRGIKKIYDVMNNFKSKMIISTSIEYSVAENFNDKYIQIILIPKSSKCLYTNIMDEYEIILPSNTYFEYYGKLIKNNVNYRFFKVKNGNFDF